MFPPVPDLSLSSDPFLSSLLLPPMLYDLFLSFMLLYSKLPVAKVRSEGVEEINNFMRQYGFVYINNAEQ